jgi:DNA-binding transcriptional LysR family regulator
MICAEQERMLRRRALRIAKHETKHAQYHKSSLNGPRALARRPLTGAPASASFRRSHPYVLPRALPELPRRHPELRLELIESQTQTLLNGLVAQNVTAPSTVWQLCWWREVRSPHS